MAQGVHLRKYGVETTIDFDLIKVDGVDFRADAAHASGDTKIMKDEGTEANTSNGFTDEGQGYSIVLDATEMSAARIVVYIVDAATKAWLDSAFIVETYGNASAMHALDLDTALASQTVGTCTTNTDLVTAVAIADQVWDEVKSGHITQGTFGECYSEVIIGTVDTVTNTHTPTTTVFQADDITEATADHFNGAIIIFTTGALAGQRTEVKDYEAVGGIGQFTVTAMTEAPANNDQFLIF